MTIREVMAYSLNCDLCGVGFEHNDWTLWEQQDWMLDLAQEEDWAEIDGGWYCDNCWGHTGEETADGDLIKTVVNRHAGGEQP